MKYTYIQMENLFESWMFESSNARTYFFKYSFQKRNENTFHSKIQILVNTKKIFLIIFWTISIYLDRKYIKSKKK